MSTWFLVKTHLIFLTQHALKELLCSQHLTSYLQGATRDSSCIHVWKFPQIKCEMDKIEVKWLLNSLAFSMSSQGILLLIFPAQTCNCLIYKWCCQIPSEGIVLVWLMLTDFFYRKCEFHKDHRHESHQTLIGCTLVVRGLLVKDCAVGWILNNRNIDIKNGSLSCQITKTYMDGSWMDTLTLCCRICLVVSLRLL